MNAGTMLPDWSMDMKHFSPNFQLEMLILLSNFRHEPDHVLIQQCNKYDKIKIYSLESK